MKQTENMMSSKENLSETQPQVENEAVKDEKQMVESVEEKENETSSTQDNVASDTVLDSEEATTEKADNLSEENVEDEIEEPKETLPDYNQFTLDELITETNKVINDYHFGESKKKIDIIKSVFYAQINAEQKKHKESYFENENPPEAYTPLTFPQEETFQELVKIFKKKRAEALALDEKEKEDNYQSKLKIIEDITALVNSTEHFNTVYNQFKQLQEQWREIKKVPSNKIKELNSSYQFALNQFYDYLHINKQLRDLDLKKNQELKEQLCERAEALTKASNPKSAFIELQDLHQNWKDIGLVQEEQKEVLWERFKSATKAINDKFQAHQNHLKEMRLNNLSKKEAICVAIEELNNTELNTPKIWDEQTQIVIDFQKQWRKIGMVPAQENEKIYSRFKSACDAFFDKKHTFYKDVKKKQKENLDKKTALIEQVEALKDSTEWKETTQKIIQIQKEFRKTGPVPRKKTELIWKRFRTACDTFFDNKNQFFKEVHGDENENYDLKLALVEEIENYKQGEDTKLCIQDLKAFQKRWSEIGFVPIKKKTELQERYRLAINKQFDTLNVDVRERDIARLKVRLDQHLESPDAKRLILNERNKLATRIKTVESDIQQFENNIGFFSSGTAKGLLKEYENKIAVNKKNLKDLRAKLKVVDDYIAQH